MNQLEIDFGMPMARMRDPGTSHMAAAQAKELAKRHNRLILDALHMHGPLGKDGIASRTMLTGVQVARRLSDLEKAGMATPTGKTVASTTGRSEREWRLA